MGLIDQYSPTINTRVQTNIVKGASSPPIKSSSLQSMGGAFILLSAKLNTAPPVRLRLYTDETSMIVDGPRPTANFNVSQSVGLIADISLDSTNILDFNPPIIGHTTDGGLVWYNLSGSATQDVSLVSYTLNPEADSDDNKQVLTVSCSSVPTTGNLNGDVITAKSFIILTGSATQPSRLRLYSRPIADIPAGEISRTFDTQVGTGASLIADLVFDSASFVYPLVPVVEGYTWEQNDYVTGTGQVGYILENLSGGVTDITASLQIYVTEN